MTLVRRAPECARAHKSCGWPNIQYTRNKEPGQIRLSLAVVHTLGQPEAVLFPPGRPAPLARSRFERSRSARERTTVTVDSRRSCRDSVTRASDLARSATLLPISVSTSFSQTSGGVREWTTRSKPESGYDRLVLRNRTT